MFILHIDCKYIRTVGSQFLVYSEFQITQELNMFRHNFWVKYNNKGGSRLTCNTIWDELGLAIYMRHKTVNISSEEIVKADD